jgi:FkbM family methyltransferase
MTNASACLKLYNRSKPFIKKFRNAVDVGCRDGDVAKLLAKDFENVYAFDYRDRGLGRYPKIHYFKCALGDVEKKVKAFAGVIVNEREGVAPMEVEQKLLDNYDFKDIDYIKIDVEGHELKVLQGAVKTIEKFNPIMVVEENGSAVRWKKGKQDEAIDFLKDMGYEIVATTKADYILEKKDG